MNKALQENLKAGNVTGSILFLAGFVLSLFFTGYEDLHYAPALLCLLAGACLAVLPAFRRGLQFPAAPPATLLFIFWLYVSLSLSWSSVPYASLVTYLVFLSMPLSFFALTLAPDRQAWIYSTGALLFAALGVLALWAVMQVAFFAETYGNRAHHPFINPNSLAGLLNLGLIPAFGLALYQKKKAWAVLAALFFIALLATGSRGAGLSALIAAVILCITLRPGWKPLLMTAAAAAILGAGTWMIAPVDFNAHSLHARLDLWDGALQFAQDYIWLGAGLGTFYLYYPSYRAPGVDGSAGQFAHMDPLQFAAEMGLAAPLLFYALALAVLIRTIRAVKRTGNKAPVLIPFCALLTLFLHTHITFHLYIMPTLAASGVLLALWYHETAKILPGRSFIPAALKNWQRPFMAAITLAIALLIAAMACSSAWGVYHLRQAKARINAGDSPGFIAAIEKAERFAPRSFIDTEVHLAGLYIDLLSGSVDGLFTMEEQSFMTQQTLALLDNAQAMNPAWAEIDHKRARLYSVAKSEFVPEPEQKAIDAWKAALRKDPAHIRAREGLATLYMNTGRAADAYDTLQAALHYPLPKNAIAGIKTMLEKIAPLADIQRKYKNRKVTP